MGRSIRENGKVLFGVIILLAIIGLSVFWAYRTWAATTAADPVVVEQSVLNKDWNFRNGVWIDDAMVLGLEGQTGDTYIVRNSATSLDLYHDGTKRLALGATNTFTGDMSLTGNITANDAGADTILIGAAADTVSIYGVLTLGDNGATAAINSSDWDISTTGAMTGIGAITMDGAFSQTGTGTFGTGTGAVSLNGNVTVATAKTINSVDNGGITANGLEATVSLLSSADAIYRDAATLSGGVLVVTFATAFSATPNIAATARAAEYIYKTAQSSTGATFASSIGSSTGVFDYIAIGAR